MPLPLGGNTPWPPKEWESAYLKYAAWSAWYSGDPNLLSAFYGGVGTPNAGGRADGFFGTQLSYSADSYDSPFWRRWMFWGKRASDPPNRYRIHVPLASDIAQTSADHLFGEPVAIVVPESREANAEQSAKDSQQRIADLGDEDGWDKTFLEGAEVSAALGGVYLRATWDRTFADRPLLTAVHPDAAVPEFRYGVLSAVTFWRTLATDGNKVYRHLESHEPGHIRHGLYEGDRRTLGRQIALSSLPETSLLTAGLDLETQAAGLELDVATGLDGLTAVYIPNIRPDRQDRSSPLGRSDLAGTEGLMDALDEVMTSWMREIRLCRARILLSDDMLDVRGKGQGSTFDADREIFMGLNQLASEGENIQFVQPAIRTAEHMSTATDLVSRIVTTAGYSPASFGMDSGGRIVTATEVAAREQRSLVTRAKKAAYWSRPLADIIERVLQIDALVFGGPQPFRPDIQFADSVQQDPKDTATALQLLSSAAAVSTDTMVRMLHPEWDDEQVEAEVARVKEEHGMGVPDPMMPPTITTNDAQLPPGQQPPGAATGPNGQATGDAAAR